MNEEEGAAVNREIAKIDCEASITQATDRMRFQHEIGIAVIRSILWSNGGSIVALLTFIGNNQASYDKSDLRNAFIAYAVGIGAALLSFHISYIGQEWLSNFSTSVAWNYQQDMKGQPRIHDIHKERMNGWRFMIVGSALTLFGIAMFITGSFYALDAIL